MYILKHHIFNIMPVILASSLYSQGIYMCMCDDSDVHKLKTSTNYLIRIIKSICYTNMMLINKTQLR